MPVVPSDRLARVLAGLFPDGDIPRLGVAVSGGGDSLALLDLLHRANVAVDVVSVHHGLRPEATAEIALVAGYCADRALSHDVLHWTWNGQGGVQGAARAGRSTLIAHWARSRGIAHIALGHTRDDQAETFLMRLSRGSGVDGLAAMAPMSERLGVIWLRPMLDITRADLRQHLSEHDLVWAEDPSNEDMAYDRVRARKMLDLLAPLGLTRERLALTADHMARARRALEACERDLARDIVRIDAGDVVIACDGLEKAPEELRTRLLVRALNFVSGQSYKPRFGALQAAMATKNTHVLHGCVIIKTKQTLRIAREWAAVAGTNCAPDDIWDGRWRLTGPMEKDIVIKILGDAGLRHCDAWRDTGRPRQSLLATPAVWQEQRLIAAPLAGFEQGWRAEIVPERSHFL